MAILIIIEKLHECEDNINFKFVRDVLNIETNRIEKGEGYLQFNKNMRNFIVDDEKSYKRFLGNKDGTLGIACGTILRNYKPGEVFPEVVAYSA